MLYHYYNVVILLEDCCYEMNFRAGVQQCYKTCPTWTVQMDWSMTNLVTSSRLAIMWVWIITTTPYLGEAAILFLRDSIPVYTQCPRTSTLTLQNTPPFRSKSFMCPRELLPSADLLIHLSNTTNLTG